MFGGAGRFHGAVVAESQLNGRPLPANGTLPTEFGCRLPASHI